MWQNCQKYEKITEWNSKKIVGDSVFSFSDSNSARSDYKNSPLFIQGKIMFKFVH